MKLEELYRIRLELNGAKIKPAEKKFIEPNPCEPGYEAIGLKEKDGRMVPNCVPIREEQSKVKKEGFPIPSPSGDEDEQAFISRCMSEISGEYDQEQGLAICYSKWRGE
jgi:hypothetical protein